MSWMYGTPPAPASSYQALYAFQSAAGDFLHQYGKTALGMERTFIELVGHVALGVGRGGMDGFGKLGAPAVGKFHLDAAGFVCVELPARRE